MSSPHPPAKPDVEMLPAAMAADQQLVDELTNLVNEVYAAAEEGLWVNGATRCTAAEIQEMIAADEIAVAPRIGYTPVRTGNIEDAYPRLSPLLATPCDFVVYHKPLDA